MRKFSLPSIILSFFVFAGVAHSQGTPLTDYQYQLDQYRKNYSEYQIFKKDYQAHPTLSNEQKALQAAKDTIIARELAWANYLLVIRDSLIQTQVNYPLINQAITSLSGIADYHFKQSQAGQLLVTRSDLTQFTQKELTQTKTHRSVLAQAQVANKLAQLIKLQADVKAAYDVLLPKLNSVKNEVTVQNGLAQVTDYSQQINDLVDGLAKKTTALDLEQSSQNQFYSDSSETLSSIRGLQNRLVDIIIELDTNYVRH